MLKPPPSAGIAIPDRDHVLRYLKPTQVKDSVVNGDGFLTRPGENAPSVNWLEWFDPPLNDDTRTIACHEGWILGVMPQVGAGQHD